MPSIRQVRLAAWSVLHLKNWFEVIQSRRDEQPLSSILLRNGLKLAVTSEERQPFFEIFSEKRYDHPTISVPKNGVIVDIGANVGIYSIYAALNLVPKGRVFSFEPIPRCVQAINQSCRENGIANITIINKAVGQADGTAQFHIAERSGDSSMFDASNSKELITVEIISPKTLLTMFSQIDLMKVDCEGGEFPLIWESGPADWEKVKAVSMEYHLGFNTGYSDGRAEDICARLTTLGFRVLSSQPTKDPRFGYIIAQRA